MCVSRLPWQPDKGLPCTAYLNSKLAMCKLRIQPDAQPDVQQIHSQMHVVHTICTILSHWHVSRPHGLLNGIAKCESSYQVFLLESIY